MTNSIDCWQWMRRRPGAARRRSSIICLMWISVPINGMTNKTWISWAALFACVKKVYRELNRGRRRPLSHTSDLVFTHCFFFFLPVFKRFFVVLHMWCLQSDAAYFLFCLFWHVLKHDKSQECKRARPVPRGGTCKVRPFPGKPTLILI